MAVRSVEERAARLRARADAIERVQRVRRIAMSNAEVRKARQLSGALRGVGKSLRFLDDIAIDMAAEFADRLDAHIVRECERIDGLVGQKPVPFDLEAKLKEAEAHAFPR